MGKSNSNQTGKKVGIIGLGSIGLRHVEALHILGIKEIYHYKTGNGSKLIPEHVKSQIAIVNDVEELKLVDAIIIANPTALHSQAINKVAYLKKPLFVEKPLVDTVEENIKLQDLLKDYPAKVQVGFCLRFHPIIIKVKEVIDSGLLGNIYFSRLDVGQYLPTWHPYTDYSQEYFSKKSLGGGAIRTLSHEIDLALYFFGSPNSAKGLALKLSHLNIDVDDYSAIFLKYAGFILNLNIDFLSRKTVRKGVIMGTQADLHYNLIDKSIFIVKNDGSTQAVDFSENDMYVEQMRNFINGSEEKGATLADSSMIMNIIQNVEHNSELSQWNIL